ncbi:hypothetical protein B9057_15795 (plasmid) [Aestuarium zhoushanense]|nr:hypothetical protein B9057_15795 [Aestuarium zhoushanense]
MLSHLHFFLLMLGQLIVVTYSSIITTFCRFWCSVNPSDGDQDVTGADRRDRNSRAAPNAGSVRREYCIRDWLALRARAQAIQAPVSIEIRSSTRRYFFATLPGATPENEDWGRRKINTVLRTFKSSMRADHLDHNEIALPKALYP